MNSARVLTSTVLVASQRRCRSDFFFLQRRDYFCKAGQVQRRREAGAHAEHVVAQIRMTWTLTSLRLTMPASGDHERWRALNTVPRWRTLACICLDIADELMCSKTDEDLPCSSGKGDGSPVHRQSASRNCFVSDRSQVRVVPRPYVSRVLPSRRGASP